MQTATLSSCLPSSTYTYSTFSQVTSNYYNDSLNTIILYKGVIPAIILCSTLSIFPVLLDYSIQHTNLQVLLSHNLFNFLLTSLLCSSHYFFLSFLFSKTPRNSTQLLPTSPLPFSCRHIRFFILCHWNSSLQSHQWLKHHTHSGLYPFSHAPSSFHSDYFSPTSKCWKVTSPLLFIYTHSLFHHVPLNTPLHPSVYLEPDPFPWTPNLYINCLLDIASECPLGISKSTCMNQAPDIVPKTTPPKIFHVTILL